MQSLIGQSISARELEEITSKWAPELFVSMCNALAWAASGRQFLDFPFFTEQVNAPDGGIDAEWTVEIPGYGNHLPTPILGPGWNVFQYKKRDLFAQKRSRIISNLKASLRGAVSEIVHRFNKTPDHYILFVNIDLRLEQRILREAILADLETQTRIHVEFLGAAELATLLNDHPHLRAAYFAPLSFKTWQEAYWAHRSHKLLGADIDLVGRKGEIERLHSLVQDKRIRVIVISGPHDIGKSRLVLEATKDRPHDVVMALDPRSMGLADYRGLSSNRGKTVCIVENPDPDSIESLVSETFGIPNLKIILTLPTSFYAPASAYGQDQRIKNIHLEPLDEKSSRELLKATGRLLDYEIAGWIIRQAKGIPGILLAAASVGAELRREGGNFLSEVGKEFEKRIKSEIGDEALKAAELFSILTHVGISGEFEDEIKQICVVFGDGKQPTDVLRLLKILEASGLAKRGGSFVEISLPILANYLVNKLLTGRLKDMFGLFARLEEPGKIRFLRRLSGIQGSEVEKFWDEFFGSDGPLGNFKSGLQNVHRFHLVAGAAPERTISLLESGLINSTRDERLAIGGEQRRELMWALEQLLFRLRTSKRALKLIWLLAEAENENFGNSATGVFEECFHPLHGQMPLPLEERIEALREFSSRDVSREGRLVVIKAVGEALNSMGGFMVRHSAGPEPLDLRPPLTHIDFSDYARDLLDILFSVATDEDNEIATAALKGLPHLIAECGIKGRPQDALERFKKLIEWASSRNLNIDVASLSDAITHCKNVFADRLDNPACPPEKKQELNQFIKELDALKAKLDQGDFFIRLKRWAGKWTNEDDENIEVKGKFIPRYELELEKLAEEIVNDPSLLSYGVLFWLISDSALKNHIFFFYLGLKDVDGLFCHTIEELGNLPAGSAAFSAYMGGWARRDRGSAVAYLETLSVSDALAGQAVVQAIAVIEASELTVEIIIDQIKKGRINALEAGRILHGPWLKGLNADHFEKLLKSLGGENFENAPIGITLLSHWMHYHDRHLGSSLTDFAWKCLESDPSLEDQKEVRYFDKLAAELTYIRPEKGFKLLKQLLLRGAKRSHWNPVDRFENHQFWDALYHHDKKRLLRLIFEVCLIDSLQLVNLTRSLKETLDLEADYDVVISFAEENEKFADIISESITAAKPGFWSIAYELVQLYPANEEIQTNLAWGVEYPEGASWGPLSQNLLKQKSEVEQRLTAAKTPSAVRSWLCKVAERLRRQISHEVVWEYDRDVNDLRSAIDDKNSPERLWAIGRVLKYGNPEDWKKLLNVSDIEEALPQIDLPEKKRKVIERALKVWKSGI